jgi:tetratricopeptide (TPR) repeat protein
MSKKHDKIMTDLHRLLETQNFKSIEEANEFLNSIKDDPIPSFPRESLTNKEIAQDLVFEAQELSQAKGKIKIEQALEIDRDCIEAYEYLGSMEQTPEIAMVFYEKGIEIGRRIYGGKFLEEHKGYFWGYHETRPFMRCLQQYADCLYTVGQEQKCISILEEMIELNPNDNQGVRELLLLYLIEQSSYEKFEKYNAMFSDDEMSFALFNRALVSFKQFGENEKSNSLLIKAMKHNKFIAKKLIANKQLNFLPDFHGIGDNNEANYYTYFAQHIWNDTDGSINWLKKVNSKI